MSSCALFRPLALPHKECYRLWSLPHPNGYRTTASHQIPLGQGLLPYEASDAHRALRPASRPECDREEQFSNTVDEALGNKIT
jgi:hypothetical protein